MDLDENKAIARRFIQLWGKGDRLAIINELASPEITVYYPSLPSAVQGIPAVRRYFTERLPSICGDPDMQVDETIAEGDKVVVRWTYSSTHHGEFPQGVPATGKRLKSTGITIYRIVEGKVVDERGEEDILGLLRQLDLLPKPRA